MKLNGKPKSQLAIKLNNGSSSQQSIGLDDEDEEGGGEEGQVTVPNMNNQVNGNKWEKGRSTRDDVASKMSATLTCIFFTKEVKNEEV